MVYAELEGEIYFPEWDKSDWKEVARKFRAKDDKNKFDMEFIQYCRV